MDVCEFDNLLGRYHDDELSDDQRRRVALHLRDCLPCAAEMEQIQAMSQSLRAGCLPVPKASHDFLARLETLADQVEETTVLRFVTRLTAAAAAILLAASLQWSFHRMNVTPPGQPTIATPIAWAPEEKMVIDPDSNVPNPGSETSSAADTQLDLLLPVSSGDRQ